ncbi:MAG TPA: TonB-dependent receptor [Chitinophagaceae bacterium]|jgi:TonB-linked SusC/RagA family outer membrane protein|nr:TonB-dependent receptor [Chitinophagaceae bacterium]
MEKNCIAPFQAWGKKCWKISLLFLLSFSFTQLFAQTIRVGGTVKDTKGNTLSGVSVTVKGTAIGTTTDNNGSFTINVPSKNSVLVFSFVGFLPKEMTVGEQQIINLNLADKTNDLDEVVIIGYGQTAKKSNLTGSISSVSNRQIQERQPINVYDALQGQAAGVLIMNDSGEPGAEGSVTIRGNNTFASEGNKPLWIVDGVLTDNPNAINPNDIDRIEVLKDAASASIYGARSAAGVILITTKKGKEGKMRLDFQYSKIFGWLAHKIQAANASELRYYRKIQNGNLSGTSGSFTDSLNPSFNTDNDLQQLLLGNRGNRDDIKLGISGGQKGLTFYGSVNYINDRGIALNTWNKSIQSRINTELQASPRLKYSTNLSFYWAYGNFTSINNSLRPVFDRASYLRIYLPDGSLTSYLNSKRNPVANALLEDNTRETLKAQMNHQIDYQFYKDLKLTASFNAELTSFEGFYFQPRFLDDNGNENFGKNDMNRTFSWLAQAFLNYKKTIGDHTFTGLVGVEKDRTKNDYTHLEGKNFIIETAHYVKGAFMDNLTLQKASANAVSTASAFTRLGYDYKGRYLVQGTYRRDASSRFGPENYAGNFFSASAAWRFSDEKFMNWTSSLLTDGKLRLSWGQTGNDRVGYYDYLQIVQTANYSYNGVAGASLTSAFGNPDLGWEATEQKDAGLDLAFLKGKLNFTIDYYIKTTSGLLYDRPFPVETGFTSKKINLGSIETRGFELQGNATPLSLKNFTWNLSGNIAFERGRILELADHRAFITGKWYIEEGGRIGNFYGWKRLGIYPSDAHNAYSENWEKLTPVGLQITTVPAPSGETPTPRNTQVVTVTGYELDGKPYTGVVNKMYANGAPLLGGDAEWVDVNGDGVIDDADRMVIGNAQPDYYFGVINNFTYKQFTLNVIVNGTIGGQVYNSFKYNLTNNSSSNGPALPEAIYGAWVTQGQEGATYPYFPDKDQRGSQRGSGNSYFLEDASFFRLSSARLTYRLKPSIAKKARMQSASLYVYGINLLTWTDYTGYDPEFSSGNALQPGDDNGKYPKRREFGMGINVSF